MTHPQFRLGNALIKSKYQELMNYFPNRRYAIPKFERMNLTKLVSNRSLPQFCLGNALMKSKYQELMNLFSEQKKYYTEIGENETNKFDPR